MSCVTCEVTPPPEHSTLNGYNRQGDHHISARLGDTPGLGFAVLFRGYDVTLQVIEALAGVDGWVEMRIMNGDGAPTLHPGAQPTCPSCAEPREPVRADPDMRDGIDWGVCACGCADAPDPEDLAYGPHPVTVIREGHVQILRGTEVIDGPTPVLEAAEP